jgi:hypothetical protein
MCKSSFATEDVEQSGSYKVNSVVLRIMIQQDNCICRVTLDNHCRVLFSNNGMLRKSTLFIHSIGTITLPVDMWGIWFMSTASPHSAFAGADDARTVLYYV